MLCISSCTSGSDELPQADRTTDTVRTIDPAKAPTLKLGEDLEIVADLPSNLGDQDANFRGFTPDGQLLGTVSLPEKRSGDGVVGGGLIAQTHPVLYDVETTEFTVLDERERAKPTQVPTIVGTRDHVVWMETPETHIASSAFALYSYDRRSKKVTRLYSAIDPGGRMVGGDDLVVAGDTVYFSRFACCRERDRGDAAVYSVPADGSSPAKVLIDGGKFVTLAGDALRYEVKGAGFSRDLTTGETTRLPVSPRVKEPGFCGAELTDSFETLCMGEPGGDEPGEVVNPVLTITEHSGRTTRFTPFPTDSLNNPVPHHVAPVGPWTGVTMTGDGGADRRFLVDLDSRTVKAFPEDSSFDELNAGGTQALVSMNHGTKAWRQVVVRIPPLS
ncbi:hypothetical protein [Aeromicrobium sp. NPDC092404]|uniref:hypothetical protein n=1 Tax=Aeromicrobium sp. NPDC092404 TaxID=3154976 RepID=UPI003433FAD2